MAKGRTEDREHEEGDLWGDVKKRREER